MAKQPSNDTVHSIMLEAALDYARANFNVVILHGIDPQTKHCTCNKGAKCPGPGKHPRLKQWTKEATTDAPTLTRLFTEHPVSNVGVMPQPGTVVVDVDPRNGGDTHDLHLPARTPTQLTGGGGAHYIVRLPDGAVPPQRAGIDYRYPGKHQIVVAPSMHASGGRYQWKPGLGVGVAAAMWRIPAAARPVAPAAGIAPELGPLPEASVQEALDAPIGMVQDWLHAAPSEDYSDWINVGQALRHAYGDDAFEMWDEWSSRSDKYPGRDAMYAKWHTFDRNRDRALRTLRSIRHLAQRNGWRYTPPELDFSSDLWRTGLVSDLVSVAPPAVEWVVGNVLPRGKVVMLAGPGGAGKSFLLLVLAIQHALGVPVLGAPDFAPMGAGPMKVISFTAEDDRDDIHRRLHAVFDAYMVCDADRVAVGESMSVQCTRGKDWRLIEEVGGVLVASKACDLIIDKLRRELNLSLLILDPSIMFAGVDENDNAAAAVYMRVLDRIASELNCAVLVGTHTNKGALSSDDLDQSAVRGASAFVDNARGNWILRTMTENEALAHAVPSEQRHRFACLRVTKNNYGPTGATVWLERVAGSGALRIAVLPTLARMGGGGASGGGAGDLPPLGGPQGQHAPPVAGTRAQVRKAGARAVAMQAHAVDVLRHVQTQADALTGALTVSVRGLARDLWSADPTMTSAGMLDRARRVLDYCEGQGWLMVHRPDVEGAGKTCTYVVTPTGKEQLT